MTKIITLDQAIDSFKGCKPDKVMDLKQTPYPFESNSISEVNMRNIIEHLPLEPEKFFPVLQEIYRISMPKARVFIRCPHPNHRWQVEDLTHQKPISYDGLLLLSKTQCQKNINAGSSKTPLAFIYNIDFEIVDYKLFLDPEIKEHITNVLGSFNIKLLKSYLMLFNNIGATQEFELSVKK